MSHNSPKVIQLQLAIKNMSVATSATQSEREFASNYLTLLSVSDSKIVIPADYRKDLKDISTLGIKLPKLPVSKKQVNGDSNDSDQLIDVTFKSIKPPRFNTSFKSSTSNTLFEVKTLLVKNEANLQGITQSQIKLLVKGKVIQDSVLLGSVANGEEQVTFTVMINKDKTSDSTPVSTPEPSTITPITKEIELPWDEIKVLLQEKGIDASSAITRLQKGWELTK